MLIECPASLSYQHWAVGVRVLKFGGLAEGACSKGTDVVASTAGPTEPEPDLSPKSWPAVL